MQIQPGSVPYSHSQFTQDIVNGTFNALARGNRGHLSRQGEGPDHTDSEVGRRVKVHPGGCMDWTGKKQGRQIPLPALWMYLSVVLFLPDSPPQAAQCYLCHTQEGGNVFAADLLTQPWVSP